VAVLVTPFDLAPGFMGIGRAEKLDEGTVRAFLAGEVGPEALPEPEWGPLGKEVFERTYAREVPDGDGAPRKETWGETVRRVVTGNLSYAPVGTWLPDEDVRLFRLIYLLKAIPAGRHLWVTGVPEVSSYSRNCYIAGHGRRLSDHFSYLAGRLFEGGGVGANYSADLRSVTPPVLAPVEVLVTCRPDHPDLEAVRQVAGDAFVARPQLQTSVPATLVEDSREGWVAAWAALIDLSTEPGSHHVVLDVSDLRPYGSPLRRFGGKASGPAPFARAAIAMAHIVSGAVGRRLSGLEMMQIDHEIAASVIAGGSRRSARLALMNWRDPEIFDFISCKADQMSHWSANISVEIDAEFREALAAGDAQATSVFEAVTTGMALNGEPGLIDTGLASETEPEPLRAVNPCYRGDTRLLTKDGLVPIKDLAGKTFEIWNGEEWAPSTAWSTGVKPVYEVCLANGAIIAATAGHVFATTDGTGEAPVRELLGRDVVLLSGPDGLSGGSSRVVSVTPAGEEEVFDFSEPKTHWGWVNGFKGHNCGEAFLASDPIDGAGESCNLGQVDLDAFGTDMDGALEATKLMARFLYRSTLNPHPDPAARRIEAHNRRIGVGIMGVQGWAAAHGYKLSELASSHELLGKLTELRRAARRAADDLADQLGTPRSVKVTAVAPTGTISNLRGTTPGPHPVFARYFVRRVRFAAHDPAWERLAAEGHEVVDDIYAASTKVVSFLMRDSVLDRHPAELIEQADEISIEQFLDLVAAVQETYCGGTDGQAVSATARIPAGTTPSELARALLPRLGRLKGATVFPDVSRALPPLEAISAERYEELLAQSGGASSVGDSNTGCIGGACPVR
jgi:ribonucleotide reductase alpha subunit